MTLKGLKGIMFKQQIREKQRIGRIKQTLSI